MAFCLLCIIACGSIEKQSRKKYYNILKDKVSSLMYIKDQKTNLCYTGLINNGSVNLVNIPCDAVEKYIEK